MGPGNRLHKDSRGGYKAAPSGGPGKWWWCIQEQAAWGRSGAWERVVRGLLSLRGNVQTDRHTELS